MRTFLRWWETLGRPERIVAMSLTAGGVVAITNSTIWAVAVCYMSHQKARAAIWRATRLPAVPEDAGVESMVEESSAANAEPLSAHSHRPSAALPLA